MTPLFAHPPIVGCGAFDATPLSRRIASEAGISNQWQIKRSTIMSVIRVCTRISELNFK